MAHKIVSPLLPLYFQNEAKEGNFRYGLVRIREYSESIAFYRGESKEHFRLRKFFQELYVNACQIIKQTLYVNLWSHFDGQIAIIMPYLLAASRFFIEKLSLGFLMQLGQAFNQVDSSLSVIVQNYPNIISWKASTLRILTFEERLSSFSFNYVPHPFIACMRTEKLFWLKEFSSQHRKARSFATFLKKNLLENNRF